MRFSILLITVICLVFTPLSKLIAQDHENVERVGRIYNQWDRAQDVVVVDTLAYLAAGRSGGLAPSQTHPCCLSHSIRLSDKY